MGDNEKNTLISKSEDIALSAAGSLVGYAIGGMAGSIVGATVSPTVKLAIELGKSWRQRHIERITNIVEQAFKMSGKTEENILQEMNASPEWCDNMISMIRQLEDSDPELDMLFTGILAMVICTDNDGEKNRLIALNNTIKGINRVQVLIIKYIYQADGRLAATKISELVKVPELELRNAVRDLELRGLIIDNGEEPTVWSLREMGVALAKTIENL
jgi:hypothetical protein